MNPSLLTRRRVDAAVRLEPPNPQRPRNMGIEVANISKTYGTFKALDRIDLAVPDGKLTALLGPSGSGKTTLLRIIAGLEVPDPGSGPIRFHDRDVAGSNVRDRRVGFVFQHYALFRHMTVFENIAFGLRVRPRATRPSNAEITQRVTDLLRLVQLEGFSGRFPSQLSGGQRQRVALARALAVEPEILLLDEPFGALDAKVRMELRTWLRRLHDEIQMTSVFVTHDQEEALEVADQVVVMNQGSIEQVGTPDDVFHHPRSAFVMNFIGQVNRLRVRPDGDPLLFVRPHELDLSPTPVAGGLRATVVRIHSAGPTARVELESDTGDPLYAEISQHRLRELAVARGGVVHVVPIKSRTFVEDYSI